MAGEKIPLVTTRVLEKRAELLEAALLRMGVPQELAREAKEEFLKIATSGSQLRDIWWNIKLEYDEGYCGYIVSIKVELHDMAKHPTLIRTIDLGSLAEGRFEPQNWGTDELDCY